MLDGSSKVLHLLAHSAKVVKCGCVGYGGLIDIYR